MQKKQTAIIDFGSSKITALVGERGINGTFLIKGRLPFSYDGFAEHVFFDVEQVKAILFSIVNEIKNILNENLDAVYIGVPSAFTHVFVKDSQISFPKKKKIVENDVDALFDSAFVVSSANYELINRSAVVFELDDFRKVANPIGEFSEILKGKLSFIICDKYFIDVVKTGLAMANFTKIEFVSSAFAETLYLIDAETRDRISVICDVGYISTSLVIVQGDGIVFQREIPFGGGYITAALTEKFGIEFDVAEKLKQKINLCSGAKSLSDLLETEDGQLFPLADIKDVILIVLDNLCESITEAMEISGYDIPEYVPLNVTGGGITFLRGAKEHIADRLNMSVKILSPKIPLSENPTESSILSLLDFATLQNS